VIEALTYRLGDHTTSDDASRYRKDADVSPHWQREPVRRLHQYLINMGFWSKDQDDRLLKELGAEIDAAADAYLATPAPDPSIVFDYTYENLPADLLAQKQAALAAWVRQE